MFVAFITFATAASCDYVSAAPSVYSASNGPPVFTTKRTSFLMVRVGTIAFSAYCLFDPNCFVVLGHFIPPPIK